jgi:hypothetical protein
MQDALNYFLSMTEFIRAIFLENAWAAVAMVTVLGFLLLARELIKNTKITEGIARRFSDVETPKIIREIRADQLISNSERREQALEIRELRLDVDTLKEKISTIGCANAVTCENRERP